MHCWSRSAYLAARYAERGNGCTRHSSGTRYTMGSCRVATVMSLTHML